MFPGVFPSLLSLVLSLCVCLLSVFVWACLVLPASGALLAGTPGTQSTHQALQYFKPSSPSSLRQIVPSPCVVHALRPTSFDLCLVFQPVLTCSLFLFSIPVPASLPSVIATHQSVCLLIPSAITCLLSPGFTKPSPPATPHQPCHPVLCSYQ